MGASAGALLLDRPGTGLSESIGVRASGLGEFASSLVADQQIPEFMKAIMLPGVRKVIAAVVPARLSIAIA